MTAFKNWVDKNGGALSVAERLGVTRAVVYMWCRRVNCPKVKNIVDILNMADGELTFWDIINSTAPKGHQVQKMQARRGKSAH